MGRYIDYFGSPVIPAERKEEFAQAVLQLFKEGGMMRREEIQIYDRVIDLLADPEYDDQGLCLVDFNLYEGNWWEEAGYNREKDRLFSHKVGGQEFCQVVYAVYLLREFYALEPEAAVIDDRIVHSEEAIGWINYVLGTSYSNQRVADLWKLFKICRSARTYFDQDLLHFSGDLPENCMNVHSCMIYTYVTAKSEMLKGLRECEAKREPVKEGFFRPAMLLLSGERFVQRYYDEPDGKTPAEKLEELKKALRKEGLAERFKDQNVPEKIRDILFHALLVPTECVLRDIADVFGADFWKLLCEMEAEITPGVNAFETLAPCPPEQPVSTSQYLRCIGQDCIASLQPGDEMEFSAEMSAWLTGLKAELDKLTAKDTTLITPQAFPQRLIDALADARETYGQVHAHRDMFYGALAHSNDIRTQAELCLLEHLNQRYRNDREHGRIWIQRHLAILADTEFRDKVFG